MAFFCFAIRFECQLGFAVIALPLKIHQANLQHQSSLKKAASALKGI